MCPEMQHWRDYSFYLENKIELKDEDRDRLDIAEWLSTYEKTRPYKCHGCCRQYELPTHLNHFTCVCGLRCRLRHVGGNNPEQAVIDAAMAYFGNERSAQLAWITEVVAGKYCMDYTADEIKKMIKDELDRWAMTDDGWRRV